VLFAGTDTGCIRAYKYPLNGEFQEFRCCGSAITQLMLTYDDAVLFASGQDAPSLCLMSRTKTLLGLSPRGV